MAPKARRSPARSARSGSRSSSTGSRPSTSARCSSPPSTRRRVRAITVPATNHGGGSWSAVVTFPAAGDWEIAVAHTDPGDVRADDDCGRADSMASRGCPPRSRWAPSCLAAVVVLGSMVLIGRRRPSPATATSTGARRLKRRDSRPSPGGAVPPSGLLGILGPHDGSRAHERFAWSWRPTRSAARSTRSRWRRQSPRAGRACGRTTRSCNDRWPMAAREPWPPSPRRSAMPPSDARSRPRTRSAGRSRPSGCCSTMGVAHSSRWPPHPGSRELSPAERTPENAGRASTRGTGDAGPRGARRRRRSDHDRTRRIGDHRRRDGPAARARRPAARRTRGPSCPRAARRWRCWTGSTPRRWIRGLPP